MTARTLSRRVDDRAAQLSARLQSAVATRAASATAAPEEGMATAEYALGTVAACALASVLVGLFKTGAVPGMVKNLIIHAIERLG